MSNLIESAKTKIREWIEMIKEHQKMIAGIIFMVGFILIVSTVSEINNKQLAEENLQLKNEITKDQMKLQMMYYIMLEQSDSITIYKTYLLNCRLKNATKDYDK